MPLDCPFGTAANGSYEEQAMDGMGFGLGRKSIQADR
jgi:hypothetical protein